MINRTKRGKKVKRKINKSVKRKKMSRFQRTRKKQGGGEIKLVNDSEVANRSRDVIPVNNLSGFKTVNNLTKIDLHRSYISPVPPPVPPPVPLPVPPSNSNQVSPSDSNQVPPSSEEIRKIVEALNMLLKKCYDYYKDHSKSVFNRFMSKSYDIFHNPRTNMLNVCLKKSETCVNGNSDNDLSKLYEFINKNTEKKSDKERLKRICTYVDQLENTPDYSTLKDSFRSFFSNYQNEKHFVDKRESNYTILEKQHYIIYKKVLKDINSDGLFKLLIKFKEVIDFETKIEKEEENNEVNE